MSEACDPIAIAALVAELAEAEKAFMATEKDFVAMSTIRNAAISRVNAIQQRLENAIGVLRSRALPQSMWKNQQGLQGLVNQNAMNQLAYGGPNQMVLGGPNQGAQFMPFVPGRL